MHPAAKIIWLSPGAPRADQRFRRCDQPLIEGEPRRLARVLQALHGLPGPDLLDAHLVHRLRVDADEAELVLGFPPVGEQERHWADQAFRALRDALPDTDVYVSFTG